MFVREMKPNLVRHFLCGIVVERPAATLTMNKMTTSPLSACSSFVSLLESNNRFAFVA